MHRYLLHNSEIHETTDLLLSPGQVGFMNGWGIFSTLLVSDGVLFAFDRHYRRMQRDAKLLHVDFATTAEDLYGLLHRLLEANSAFNATLRVCCVRNKGGMFEARGLARDSELIAFTSDRRNWTDNAKLMTLPNARHAASPFAGTKVTSWAQNLTWYETAHEHGFDEMLLLNEHGQVSECTSANLFMIHGNSVWTPPLGTSGCLPGVTRAILLEEIEIPGVTIGERDLTPDDLLSSDGVLITSSTRDLLAVASIDGTPVGQNSPLLGKLQNAFAEYREQYLAQHRKSNEMLAI